MKFRPLHDRVLIRRVDADERTAGGIIIPDPVKKNPSKGKLLLSGRASVTTTTESSLSS
jgi:chaperonin GroES